MSTGRRSPFATQLFLSSSFFLALFVATLAWAGPAAADQRGVLATDGIGVPLRVRDYTFPGFLVLGFAPMPSAPLGRGNYAFELHASVINDFQVSNSVEEYLAASRPSGERRSLDERDVDAILALPEGESFYIDGEYEFADVAFFYGLTDHLDIGIMAAGLRYSSGRLDRSIFDFHDRFGYGQQGRNFVADHRFQIVFGADELPPIVTLDGAGEGGAADPSLFLRYAFPARSNGWQYGFVLGVKAPLADVEFFRSTGSWDYGLQLVADRRFERNALIVNLSAVKAGNFEQNGFEPPLLTALHLSFLHQFRRLPRLRWTLQALVAEHPFRELVDSELSALETQLTLGFKLNTRLGVFGLGLTENILNMDNTPDIGLHFSWGLLVMRDAAP